MSNHHQIFGDVSTEFRFHQHCMPLPRQFTTTAAAVSQPIAKAHKQQPHAFIRQCCSRLCPEKGKRVCVLLSRLQKRVQHNVRRVRAAAARRTHAPRACSVFVARPPALGVGPDG